MDYYEYWKNSKGNRDVVFEDVFNNLKKSITILEIGVSRNLDKAVRGSDGWSSLFFANHIKQYGGKLISVDLEPTAIENCKVLCEELDKDILHEYITDTGVNALTSLNNEDIDFIYLDGGDDPQEMVDEYELILNRKYIPLVLCDDFHTKSVLMREKYPTHTLYKWLGNPHELGFYNGKEPQIKFMKIIE